MMHVLHNLIDLVKLSFLLKEVAGLIMGRIFLGESLPRHSGRWRLLVAPPAAIQFSHIFDSFFNCAGQGQLQRRGGYALLKSILEAILAGITPSFSRFSDSAAKESFIRSIFGRLLGVESLLRA